MADSNTIFREKSLEKVSSPEQLDSYLKVTSVGVWAILAAIIFVLVGAVIWGTVGKIESKLTCVCVVQEGQVYCLAPSSKAEAVEVETMTIDIKDDSYQIVSKDIYGQYTSNIEDPFMSMAGAENGELVYTIVASCPNLSDGTYEGKIVTETISPLKFVFN